LTSACEPFREAIELGLSRGRNAIAIWQDLVAEHGLGAGYLSVQRFVRRLRGNQPAQARAVICTPPASEKHIRTAIGRDYADVPPTMGMMKGKAETQLQVRVRVTPSQGVLPPDEEFAADEEWSQFLDETQSELAETEQQQQ